jgi:hypothetical protein
MNVAQASGIGAADIATERGIFTRAAQAPIFYSQSHAKSPTRIAPVGLNSFRCRFFAPSTNRWTRSQDGKSHQVSASAIVTRQRSVERAIIGERVAFAASRPASRRGLRVRRALIPFLIVFRSTAQTGKFVRLRRNVELGQKGA